MLLEKFDLNNIPLLVDRVLPLWAPVTDDDIFRRIYVEMVVRHNMADNDMQFQICDGGELQAITFAEKKDEECSIEKWWQEQVQNLSDEQKIAFTTGREYLRLMDEKTFSYMNRDDVKLSLFISLKKGAGKIILAQTADFFRKRGFKNMYLWTDCECDVDWYFDHGYELVEKSVYEKYSFKDYEYLTYIFKKAL